MLLCSLRQDLDFISLKACNDASRQIKLPISVDSATLLATADQVGRIVVGCYNEGLEKAGFVKRPVDDSATVWQSIVPERALTEW